MFETIREQGDTTMGTHLEKFDREMLERRSGEGRTGAEGYFPA